MWTNSFVTPVVLIPTLVILQISYGKPTAEEPPLQNLNATTATTTTNDFFLVSSNSTGFSTEGADLNSSSVLQTVSVLLTVISENDSLSGAASSFNSSNIFLLNDANNDTDNSTIESDYYLDGANDHNNTVNTTSGSFSSTQSVLEEGGFDTMSIYQNSTESSLITNDEIDAAGSLDEAVTAAVLTATTDVRWESIKESSSNLNVDTVQPPGSHAENEGTKQEDDVIATTQMTLVMVTTPSFDQSSESTQTK